MKALTIFGIGLFLLAEATLAHAQVPTPAPACNPTGFVNIKGCKIHYWKCPAPGVIACTFCPDTNEVVTTVTDQTNTGLQVEYKCSTAIQNAQIPANQLSLYTITTCGP